MKLVAGSVIGGAAWAVLPKALAAPFRTGKSGSKGGSDSAVARDAVLAIAFDHNLHTRLVAHGKPLTPYQPSESLLLADGAVEDFTLSGQREQPVTDARHGAGHQTIATGRSSRQLEKEVTVTFFDSLPGFAVLQTRYRNLGDAPLQVTGWRNAAHELADAPGGFWSFAGATHTDRRDWVLPLGAGFNQRNTLGMDSSDYGGGIPMADIWRRDVGLAVGHVEPVVRQLNLPVRKTAGGAHIAVESPQVSTLAPGQTLTTERTLLAVHTGDYFAPLQQYRQFMQADGLVAPEAPASAFAPVWCTWGYGRDFSVRQILDTVPKARDLGFGWVVLDDGWQTNEGDWRIDTHKFPRGDADMRAFTATVRSHGMHPRLWLAPLAADPGSDILHDHADMLLLDKHGAFQTITWWNALTQCPAYRPTVDYYVALVKKIIGDWGFEGIKFDGQHLNAVAPCYNPAHKHARPEESVEGLAAFWSAIHQAVHEANPQAVVELCPCGTVFAFHNLPATDQYPASDPLSSWQVRSKGKTMKALMASRSSYAGDHVELSDHGDDFASTVGIGAVVSSKFTWPKDTDHPAEPLPPGGYKLTAEKEALWRKWVALYQRHMLPKGEYLGTLYDIGFDRPEAHAIAKDGAMYYAFYADHFDGALQLRGLPAGRHRVRDLFNQVELGEVDAGDPTLHVAFKRFVLLQATPLAAQA
ncbi:glycoside hydrolase family 36 protein [Rhodanobacter thiooxydans]|uniref:glycoside hydrolase family 36 protein n=1 Tax=Rhodanobacter thiooxydans TaxID=416169 RepID=UPI001F35153B|nr:alpha-galactosidase [Rhodanobacter thiooxydans]MCW0203368.1 alpha-galactosidase [Rhodanobacter thiooxydans]